MEDTLKLIGVATSQDRFGRWTEAETSSEVFCNVRSVTRTEFFEAGRNGLNPAFVFTVFGDDYAGQETIEFHSERYGVYRTYRDGDDLELYAERKGGTNVTATTGGTS